MNISLVGITEKGGKYFFPLPLVGKKPTSVPRNFPGAIFVRPPLPPNKSIFPPISEKIRAHLLRDKQGGQHPFTPPPRL